MCKIVVVVVETRPSRIVSRGEHCWCWRIPRAPLLVVGDDMPGDSFIKKKKDRERAIKQARQDQERSRILNNKAATRIQSEARAMAAKRIAAELHASRHRTPKQILADRHLEWLEDRRKTRQSGYVRSPSAGARRQAPSPVLDASPLKPEIAPEIKTWQDNQAKLRKPGFTRSLGTGSAPALLPPRPTGLRRAVTESSISTMARLKSMSRASPRHTTVHCPPDQMSDGPPATLSAQYPCTRESPRAAAPPTPALSRIRRASREASQHVRRMSNEVCEHVRSSPAFMRSKPAVVMDDVLEEVDSVDTPRNPSHGVPAGPGVEYQESPRAATPATAALISHRMRRISNEVRERLRSSPGYMRSKPGGVMDGVVDSWRARVQRVSNELFA